MTPPQGNWPQNQIKPFLGYLDAECGLTENTVLAYHRDIRRFAEFCTEKQLRDPNIIKPLDVQNFARELFNLKLSTATIARHLSAVKMFLRFHLLTSQIKTDICQVIESPKTWQRLPRVLTKQRTNELLAAVDPESSLAMRDRALLELLYATGMRASEIADLQIENINFQIGFLRCFGKGRKERVVPVHQHALNLVTTYLKELRPILVGTKTTQNLFVSRTGRPLDRIEIWRIVKRTARNAGMIGKVTPHTLRHCFGTHLLQGGADLRSVQEMLGHVNVTTTQIYTHVDQEHLRGIHKKYHPRP